MKTTFMKVWCVLSLLMVAAPAAFGQFPEDALRYSWQELGPGGRSLGMGTAGMSFLDDYSSIYWNPAGIGQAKLSEFSFGLSTLSYQNTATFMGTENSFTNSETSLDNLGLVYAIPTARGSLSFAIGYDRSNDFTTGLSFAGFNPGTNIIQSWAPDGQPYPPYITRAEVLELAFVDTINGTFISPIDDSVDQAGTTLEGGGMSRFSLTGATEAARNLYVGVSLNFLSGSYEYSNRFSESDGLGLYQDFPFDFNSLEVRDFIEADISGFNINSGLIYRISKNARFAFTVKTPSWITVQERFTSEATSWFDDGSTRTDPPGGDYGSYTEYDVTTPWVFSTGLSGGTSAFTLAGAVEFIDFTQMEFNDATNSLLDLNTDIKQLYRSTVNIRLGGEVHIPETDFSLRAGYILLPSPYEGDPTSFDRTYITGGIGLNVVSSFGIDLAYAHGSWEAYRWLYGDTYTDLEEITTHTFKGTVSYRF